MADQPLISIIIPTRRRKPQLRRCLASLAELAYPPDRWEVIVVEDDDQEPPDEELKEARLPLRYLRQSHQGCGLARNTGAAQARGRYLVFTDDDCLFPADWLWRYERRFAQAPDCLLAGRSVNALPANPYSEASQGLSEYLLARLNASPGQATLAIGNNAGVPAGAFRDLGGFGARYFRMAAEDRDFSARWLAAGRRIVYAPEIVVHHAHGLNLRTFLAQHFRYGRGAWLFHRLQAQRGDGARGLQPAGFYSGLLLSPWSARAGAKAARMSLLFSVAQAAHTAGYVRELIRRSA